MTPERHIAEPGPKPVVNIDRKRLERVERILRLVLPEPPAAS